VCTDIHVETLIVCWLIEGIARHICSKTPELFWRPYYNTPLVPMLRAHANQQVLQMYAVLCGTALCKTCRAAGNKQKGCADVRCGKPMTRGISLRGLDDLKNHRDVLGHPLTFQLERPRARQFVDQKRDRYDIRPALVWDIHRSIVEAQTAAGVPATVLKPSIGPYQTAVLDSILRLSMNPGGPPIGEDFLAVLMSSLWTKAQVHFERYPDGQSPRKTDSELKEIYEKMKAEWYASRPTVV
jgi:hypothetical protein